MRLSALRPSLCHPRSPGGSSLCGLELVYHPCLHPPSLCPLGPLELPRAEQHARKLPPGPTRANSLQPGCNFWRLGVGLTGTPGPTWRKAGCASSGLRGEGAHWSKGGGGVREGEIPEPFLHALKRAFHLDYAPRPVLLVVLPPPVRLMPSGDAVQQKVAAKCHKTPQLSVGGSSSRKGSTKFTKASSRGAYPLDQIDALMLLVPPAPLPCHIGRRLLPRPACGTVSNLGTHKGQGGIRGGQCGTTSERKRWAQLVRTRICGGWGFFEVKMHGLWRGRLFSWMASAARLTCWCWPMWRLPSTTEQLSGSQRSSWQRLIRPLRAPPSSQHAQAHRRGCIQNSPPLSPSPARGMGCAKDSSERSVLLQISYSLSSLSAPPPRPPREVSPPHLPLHPSLIPDRARLVELNNVNIARHNARQNFCSPYRRAS